MPTASINGVMQSWDEYEKLTTFLDNGIEFLDACIPFLQKVALSSPMANGVYSEEAARLLEIAGEPLADNDYGYEEHE